jgi:hypothetical protein
MVCYKGIDAASMRSPRFSPTSLESDLLCSDALEKNGRQTKDQKRTSRLSIYPSSLRDDALPAPRL